MRIAFPIFVLSFFFMISASEGVDQTGKESNFASLSITTFPSSAEVHVSGALKVKGLSPFIASELPPGQYGLKILRRGYEEKSKTVRLGPGEKLNLNFELSRKSRWEAGLKSILFPGWGQHYGEYKLKGWIFTLSELAALGSAGFLKWKYRAALDDYNGACERYREATYIGDIEKYREEMKDTYKKADRYFGYLQTSLYVGGGIWTVSFFDAFLFTPGGGEGIKLEMRGKEQGEAKSRSWSLAWKRSF